MPTSAPRSLLRSLASLLALATPLAAQSATLLVGNPGDPVDLRVVHWNGSVTDTLDAVLLHPIDGNGRSDDLLGGLDGHGHVTIGGWPWLELADSTRLAIFERTTTTGHGLVLVPPDGAARIVYEASHQLDVRMAIAADGRHLAFARGTQLTFVRLTGSPYADGAWHRTVLLSDDALGQSLVIGPSHAFFVTDDDHVYRCSLADAGLPEAVTPNPGASVAQGDRMALSGDGRVAAFLRGQATDEFAVWVVGTTGPARMLALPESNYLQPDLLPSGTGEPHLLLSHDGSRVMVTELQTERELHHVETGLAGGPQHLTGDAMFAEYIGGHILPKWSGSRLLFASGHDGWRDWYVRQPDGTVDNLTQTGSPILRSSSLEFGTYSVIRYQSGYSSVMARPS